MCGDQTKFKLNKKENSYPSIRIKADSSPVIQDESPHEDSAIEWWFVQGYYEDSNSGRRDFMTSLFLQNMKSKASDPLNGFSLILSVLDPIEARQSTLSQIDSGVVELYVRLGEYMRRSNLDPHIIEAFINEVVAYGPPKPIRLEKAKAKLSSNPFSAVWKDFSLSQSDKKFSLSFIEPGSRRHCQFELNPIHSRMYIEGLGEPYIKSMAYVTYPHLELVGRVGEEEVRGKAWLDHQWGNYGWFVTQPLKGKVLGWDWFGINLEDGSDWLILIHRDMKSRKPVTQSAIIREKRKKPRLYQKLTAEPVRYWKSQVTHIRYPVAWRIEIPELGAELTFEPSVDDQEIQVFGAIRAIWEGTGVVSGKVAGRTASGRARLELHGYGYIFNFKNYMNSYIDRIDNHIEEFFPKVIDEAQLQNYVGPAQSKHEASVFTKTLSKPIWDLISRKGKHWRPVFGILMLEALDVPSKPYEKLLSNMPELSHTGALIIDDIEDNSRIRRGKECIHLRYGLDVAINAANTIYFLPLLILSDHPHLSKEQRREIYQIIIEQFVKAHFGQGQDIYWSKNMTVRNLARWINNSMGPKVLQMYAYKTGALVEGMAEIACVIARSNKAVRRACISFARNLSVAFQIIDDVHNFSDSPKWAKTCGEDLSARKLTYVIIRALENLKPSDRNRLQRIMCSRTLSKEPALLREGIDLVRSSGALGLCRREAKSMFEKEWNLFSKKLPPSEPKIILRMLCSYLLNLTY